MTRPPGRARLAASLLLLVLGCRDPEMHFRRLPPATTGVDFANTITDTEAHGFDRDVYLYNGAGVAIGDVDGDGRPDLYFAGNMLSSRLYLNRGGMRFQDATSDAGVSTRGWVTGVAMVDIDGDGDLDLYLCRSGPEWSRPEERRNLLFVNLGAGPDGVPRFREEAGRYGIADSGYSTHAVFFDYDRDGYLDLFVLGNPPGAFGRGETGFGGAPEPAGLDRLYHNDGNDHFTDVSERAGLRRELGYGLGAVATDLNGDGWPDLYVSDDATPGDRLYVNGGDGTFTERSGEWLGHTSAGGMGIDVADVTGDGWPDVVQTDMMPERLEDRKRVSHSAGLGTAAWARRSGSAPQYVLNSLQWNRGPTAEGGVEFSEIGRIAGIAFTGWSWSALLADFDNDGRRDLFITTGFPKTVQDLDYQGRRQAAFQISDERGRQRRLRALLDSLPAAPSVNYLFRNRGDLTFENRTAAWGLDDPGFSYGAAYGDLDGDGRLDLVVNNVDAPASIYRNVPPRDRREHWLAIRLEGEGPNRRGLGAHVSLTVGGRYQSVEHTPFRGYLSTMEDRIHFGLGAARKVERLEVRWPDGRMQALTGIAVDAVLTVRQRDARERWSPAARSAASDTRPFRRLPAAWGLTFVDRESSFRSDLAVQPLLPEPLSHDGPPVAVADVDGDGREDVFVGGGAGSPGVLYLQRPDGRFARAAEPEPWTEDRAREDAGALFFDADGDGRPDLYVASGGYVTGPASASLQDRLYLNRGDGHFEKAVDALPEMLTSTAAVRAADFDGDGRLDLFVGGRLVPLDYPAPARSYLLRNEGGRFVDVTERWAPELLRPGGMVTDALWIDFDGDGRPDLVTAGTWMPIRFYANGGKALRDVTPSMHLPPLRGWWYRLAAGDLDGDGRPDVVAGNLGLNSSYTASPEAPFGLYAGPIDPTGARGLILTEQLDGREYPYHGLAVLGAQSDLLRLRFPSFDAFARADVEEIFGRGWTSRALHRQADTFASVWLRNEGGVFTVHPLPTAAQIAPVRGVVIHDVDGDGLPDVVVAGNARETDPNTAPLDAGKGLWLRGDGRGGFTPVEPRRSGFLAPGDARQLALVRTSAGPVLLVANRSDSLQAFQLRSGGRTRRSPSRGSPPGQ